MLYYEWNTIIFKESISTVSEIKIIDAALLQRLRRDAAASPRLRTHFCLHENNDAPFHRLAVASQPGTRVRPHRHTTGEKWELLTILDGGCDVLVFDDAGRLERRIALRAGQTTAVEMSFDTWHGFVVHPDGCVFLEVKPGPYARPVPEDWAPWAPDENAPEAVAFEAWCRTAAPGETFQHGDGL